MAYGAAGRAAKTHDIYIFVILKHFLGNHIEYEIILSVPRAVFPARRSFRRFRFPSCRVDAAKRISSMIGQPIVLTIMRLIVPPLSCRPPCRSSRRSRSTVRLIRPSRRRPVISSARPRFVAPSSSRSLITRPASLHAISTSRTGRGVAFISVFRIAVSRSLSCLVRCRGMWRYVDGCRMIEY